MSNEDKPNSQHQTSLAERMSAMSDSIFHRQHSRRHSDYVEGEFPASIYPQYPTYSSPFDYESFDNPNNNRRLPKEYHNYKHVSKYFIDFTRSKRLNDSITIPYSLRYGYYSHGSPRNFDYQAEIIKRPCKSCFHLNRFKPPGAQEIICVISPGYARCSLCICLNLPYIDCGIPCGSKSREVNDNSGSTSYQIKNSSKRKSIESEISNPSLSPEQSQKRTKRSISHSSTTFQEDSIQIAGISNSNEIKICTNKESPTFGEQAKEMVNDVKQINDKDEVQLPPEKGTDSAQSITNKQQDIIADLCQTNLDIKKENNQLREELIKLKQEIGQLNQVNNQSKKENVQQKEENQKSKIELENFSDKLDKVQNELRLSQDVNKKLTIDREDFSSIKENFKKIEKVNNSLRIGNQELNKSLEEKIKTINQLNIQLNKVQKQKDEEIRLIKQNVRENVLDHYIKKIDEIRRSSTNSEEDQLIDQ